MEPAAATCRDEMGGARAQSGPRGSRLLPSVEARDSKGDYSRVSIWGIFHLQDY
jgi:hypothetical protein